MTEADYILATTVARIGCAVDCLRFVLAVEGVMTEKQLNDVKTKLSWWCEKLYEQIETEDPDERPEPAD